MNCSHEVTLTKGFWIADTPVTQTLWEVVMDKNPSRFNGADRPVDNVSWNDAHGFIEKMNGLKAELKLSVSDRSAMGICLPGWKHHPILWG